MEIEGSMLASLKFYCLAASPECGVVGVLSPRHEGPLATLAAKPPDLKLRVKLVKLLKAL